MELDELKQKWAAHDRKLDAVLRLNRELLGATVMNRARGAMRRLSAFLVFEVAMMFLAIVPLSTFIYGHLAAPRFALPAIALDLFAIGIVIATIRQMVSALQIDYRQPVAVVQRQIEGLRVRRSRVTLWILLASPLVWTPLVIVVFAGCFGVDVYRIPGKGWLLGNLAFGLAIIPLALWVSKRFGDRMNRSPLIQGLMRDLAGHNLKAAAGFLAGLSAFEGEERRADR